MSLDIAQATVKLNDLTATFDSGVDSAAPFYPDVCTMVPSSGAEEKYGWLGSMPGVREWIGERQFQELRSADYSLENKLWEQSVPIKKTDLSDDRMGLYGPVLGDLGEEAALHPDELLLEVLTNGESTTCFDGQFFFDTDHAFGTSGTQSNDLTYNAADTANITTAEFKAAFRASVNAMLKFKNDNGKFYHRPTINRLSDLVVFVPVEMRDAAHDALEAQVLSNDSNVIIDRPRIVAAAGVASTKFYTMRVGQRLRPFVFQARSPLSRQIKGLNDIEEKDVKFMTEARYNLGYLAWWNATLTTLT